MRVSTETHRHILPINSATVQSYQVTGMYSSAGQHILPVFLVNLYVPDAVCILRFVQYIIISTGDHS